MRASGVRTWDWRKMGYVAEKKSNLAQEESFADSIEKREGSDTMTN